MARSQTDKTISGTRLKRTIKRGRRKMEKVENNKVREWADGGKNI